MAFGVLGHDYVGPEHLLLGLLGEGGGKGVRVLADLGVGAEALRAEILAQLRPGRGFVPVGGLPYTSRGKKVLEFSMAAARQSGRAVDTEHLLLGLMMEEKSLAAQVLDSAEVTLDDVRQALLAASRRVGDGAAPAQPRPAARLGLVPRGGPGLRHASIRTDRSAPRRGGGHGAAGAWRAPALGPGPGRRGGHRPGHGGAGLFRA